MKKSLLLFLVLCNFLSFSQVNYTANDIINTYPEGFRSGINPGYYGQNWNNYTLADIMGKNYATNTDGIGVESLRTNLPESLAEIWGYDTWTAIYDYYAGLGLKDNTLVIGISSPDHRDKNDYCPNDPVESEMFANLYEPIWDNGENGTPINDNNYFALYVYNLIQTVGQDVKFWEIWNEPGFDISGKSSIPKGQAGNWWDNDPEPCDFILRAPLYNYIRTLRISYEVIKTLSPNDYIVLSGVGNDSFLDALLRNTDNPNNGDVSNDFPLTSGAYFDVMGFHAYPSIDGSVRKWNNDIQDFDYTRHSDGSIKGFKERIQNRQNLLSQYGYDGATYPKKLWTITEFNVSRKKFGNSFGSDELQRNYIIKMVTTSIEEHIVQTHLYAIGELEDENVANDEFQLMGLYKRLNDIHPGEEIITEQGIAYKTTIKQLAGTSFDANHTAQLNLPDNIGGGAYKKGNGQYIYVLWAKTQTDDSENASATYSFPSLGFNQVYKMNWDFSSTGQFENINAQNIALTGTPIFLNPNSPPSTLSVTFPDGNIAEGTGSAAQGGTTITWAAPIVSSTCTTGEIQIEVNNLPDNNFYTFGERSIQYTITDGCGNVAYASVLVKVASTGGPGFNCHPHHWDFNFLGSFQGHKYLLARTKMTPAQALVAAETHGGYLASIETEEENHFLAEQLYEVVLIGLSDRETEGTLKWESGAPVTFTKFDNCDWCGTNAPNSDFLEFHKWNESWSYVDNNGEYFFVVELDCNAPQPTYSISLNCPDVITVETNNPNGQMVNLTSPNIISDCPNGYQTIQQTNSWGTGNIAPIGTSQVTYSIQDNCGNSTSCTQNITVNLISNITVQCLDNIQVQTTNPNGTIVNWNPPTAITNCIDNTISRTQEQGLPSGSMFPMGINRIKYKFVDNCGNTEYCSFKIIVSQEYTVGMICPDNLEVTAESNDGMIVNWNEPTVTTNCPEPFFEITQTGGPTSGSLLPVGTTTISYHVKDFCNNETDCTFNIVVNSPIIGIVLAIECPEDIELTATINGTAIEWTEPTITSTCPNGYTLTQTSQLSNGSIFPIGKTIVVYRVTDNCENELFCSFEINVLPQIILEVECPSDIEIMANSEEGTIVNWETPIVNSNCASGYEIIQTTEFTSGDLFPIGKTIIEYSVTDQCGNSTTCNFEINVTPIPLKATTTAICQADTTVITKDPSGIKVSWNKPIVTTDCPNGYQSIQILGPNNGSFLPLGKTQIGYKIQDIGDGCETVIECNFEINVVYTNAVEHIENQFFSIDKIYPNPTQDIINIEIKSVQKMEIPFVLTNTLGQIVINTKKEIHNGDNKISLDVNALGNGVYYLKIGNGSFLILKE